MDSVHQVLSRPLPGRRELEKSLRKKTVAAREGRASHERPGRPFSA